MDSPDFGSRHTQTMPEQWPDLLHYTNTLLEDSGELTLANAFRIHNKIGELDDNTFDRNRYFALGEMMVFAAQELRQPELRAGAIQAAAAETIKGHGAHRLKHGHTGEDGMHYFEINQTTLAVGMRTVTDRAADLLDPGARRLADLLEFQSRARHGQHKTGRPTLFRDIDLPTLVGVGFASRRVSEDSLAGPTGIALLGLGSKLSAADKVKDMLIRDIVDPRELANPDLVRVALNAAKLHADEFTSAELKRLTYTRPDGTLAYDRSKITKTPVRATLVPGGLTRSLHDERIGCPALYVTRFIPEMLTIIPDVILEVDDRLAPVGK